MSTTSVVGFVPAADWAQAVCPLDTLLCTQAELVLHFQFLVGVAQECVSRLLLLPPH
jgi:hypothetical protein